MISSIICGILLMPLSTSVGGTYINDNLIYPTSTTSSENQPEQVGFNVVCYSNRTMLLNSYYGYVTYQYNVFKTPFTEKSDLFLIKTNYQFTPGGVAVANGLDYDDCYLDSGYVHQLITPLNQPWRHSADMNLIASFPLSNNITSSYTSSFGVTCGLNSSFTNGVSIGSDIVLKTSTTTGAGLSLDFNNSVSSTTSDPLLSQQYSPNNMDESQWNFYVITLETAGRVTYNLETYQLIEIAHNGSNCANYAMDFKIDIRFTITYADRLIKKDSAIRTTTNNIGY